MKTKGISTAAGTIALTLFAGDLRAETAADIGTLPSQKIPASVSDGDRNPFATRIAIEETGNSYEAESEESKIRQIFASLTVDGFVPATGGKARVLVGDLILEEGVEIPSVIENQTDVLRVTRIDSKEVEVTWVDEEQAEQPRKLIIPVKLEPEVSFILPGRPQQTASAGQFVTMGKPGDEEANKENAPGGGEADEDLDETEDEETGAQPAQEKKRTSPFGLFRR